MASGTNTPLFSFGNSSGFGSGASGTSGFGTGTGTGFGSGITGTTSGFGTGTGTTSGFGSGLFGSTVGTQPQQQQQTPSTNAFSFGAATPAGITSTPQQQSGFGGSFGSSFLTPSLGSTAGTTTGASGLGFGAGLGSGIGMSSGLGLGSGMGMNSGSGMSSGLGMSSGFGMSSGLGMNSGLGLGLGQTPTTTGGFGSFPQNTLGSYTPRQANAVENPSQRLLAIKELIDPSSPHYRFRHYFYNIVHPNDVQLYANPPNKSPRWELAWQDRPDPSCMVPVEANGFDDLKKRLRRQDVQAAAHASAIKKIEENLTGLQADHDLNVLPKIAEYQRKHAELTHRVLKVMRMLESLRSLRTPGVIEYSIEEENLRAKFESLQRELDKPTQFMSKLNELHSSLQLIKESREVRPSGFVVADETSFQRLEVILEEQQEGLSVLTDIVKSDKNDLGVMAKGYQQSKQYLAEYSG